MFKSISSWVKMLNSYLSLGWQAALPLLQIFLLKDILIIIILFFCFVSDFAFVFALVLFVFLFCFVFFGFVFLSLLACDH